MRGRWPTRWRVEPEHGLNAVRGNAVEQWLRRGLGDAQLAARVEELVRHRSLDSVPDDGDGEAALVMRVIAVLDPLAPLCWRGVALWPDGIGTALAAAQASDPDTVARLEEIVIREEAGNWAALRADRCDLAVLRVEARQQHSWLQQRAQGAGVPRLTYLLNPLMPCASPLAGRALGGAPCRICCRRWRRRRAASTTGRPNRSMRMSLPLSPPALSGAWTMTCPPRPAVATRGLPAWRSFACWRSCSRDCTPSRCRRWPPGSARVPGRCWRTGGIASVAPGWRSGCGR